MEAPDGFRCSHPAYAEVQARHAEIEAGQAFKIVTLRPPLEEVALLDALAKVLGKSRNQLGIELLQASMREAFAALPEELQAEVKEDIGEELGLSDEGSD